jgi:hypothetical protein
MLAITVLYYYLLNKPDLPHQERSILNSQFSILNSQFSTPKAYRSDNQVLTDDLVG